MADSAASRASKRVRISSASSSAAVCRALTREVAARSVAGGESGVECLIPRGRVEAAARRSDRVGSRGRGGRRLPMRTDGRGAARGARQLSGKSGVRPWSAGGGFR